MYPEYTTIDCETTGACNGTFGNPFTDSNRLCVIGYGNISRSNVINLSDESIPFGRSLRTFESENIGMSVGFNWKFDAHWLRRYGVNISSTTPIWDCQLAHFIIHDQQKPLPSLEECSQYYRLEDKFIDIERDYWDKGVDTDCIPFDIVRHRVESDVKITSQLAELQWDLLKKEPGKKKLIWVSCQDQKVLEEMEWNGLKYDLELSKEEGNKIRARQKEIETSLNDIVGIAGINWGSKDQLSYILYGGTLSLKFRESFIFIYKDGSTAPKERWSKFDHLLPRRIEPLPGTEYSKGGVFSTDEDTLSKLKPRDNNTKNIIFLMQEYRTLDKIVSTYFHGIPKLYEEMEWIKNIIHGQLNSVVTRTGRLSSSKPNQQNMDYEIRKCIISRF